MTVVGNSRRGRRLGEEGHGLGFENNGNELSGLSREGRSRVVGFGSHL
jgi:hypothetical protein